MSVSAELQESYVVEFPDGRRIGIHGDSQVYENLDRGEDFDIPADIASVVLSIPTSRSDTDSRAVIAIIVLSWLAAAWVGLSSLGRVVTAAVDGRAFADGNPGRLRWLGTSIIAVPTIDILGRVILTRTLGIDLPVTVSVGSSSLWVLAVTGIGMFALAEVFAEAARLREFEEATV